jgi:tetratricopeptide (TPR) repeat protein
MAEPKSPPRKGPSTDELLRRWEADKKRSLVFLQLAEEYRKQDFVDAAISVLREGLKHHPGSQPARVALARCLVAKSELAEGQVELEKVCKRSPDNILAAKLLAEVLEQRGEKRRALDCLRSVKPFAPEDPEVEARLQALESELAPRSIPVPGPGAEADTTEFLTGELDVGAPTPADGGGRAPVPVRRPVAAAPTTEAPPPPPPKPERPAPARAAAPHAATAAPEPSAEDGARAGHLVVEDAELLAGEEEEEPGEADTTGDGVLEAVASAAEAVARPVPPARPPAIEGLLPAEPPADLLGPPRASPAPGGQDDLTSITLAELYEQQGAHADAIAHYESVLARRPDDATIRMAIERCRARLQGASVAAVMEAVAAPAAPPKPRWQPVRPRPLPSPAQTPQPAAAARPAAAPVSASPRRAHHALVLAELRRWLDAARAVRQ